MIVCIELNSLSDVRFHESLLNISRESREKLRLAQVTESDQVVASCGVRFCWSQGKTLRELCKNALLDIIRLTMNHYRLLSSTMNY